MTQTMAVRRKKRVDIPGVIINAIFTFSSIFIFILPFYLVISVSLTSDAEMLKNGYQFFPEALDFTAYRYVFSNTNQLVASYITTAGQSFLGTFLSVVVMSLCAYSLSRPYFFIKKPLTLYIFFTMIFSGGLIPSYIINTQYLKLGNSFWVYILPGLVAPFYLIIIRTFFQGLPPALAESAKIDGANEFVIFSRIAMPLSKPVLATVALLLLLDRWNNWYTSMIYIRSTNLYTLQYLLQRILLESQTLKSMIDNLPPGMSISATDINMPVEGLRYAMCVVAAGPMVVIFPFFQKYFSRGLTVGAVKG